MPLSNMHKKKKRLHGLLGIKTTDSAFRHERQAGATQRNNKNLISCAESHLI